MRKMLLLSLLGLTVLTLALGASAAAARAGHPDHPGPRGPLGRLMMARMGRAMTLRAEMNLTDEQKGAIREVVQAHKQDLATAIQPAVNAHRALRDAVLADKTDDAAIRKAADDLGKKAGDAAIVIAKVKAEAIEKAKLTPEQIKKFTDFRAANDASVDEFFAHVGEK